MKLIVTTALVTVVEADDVVHVRAEDDSGAFGIWRGHSDFLTALSVSVLSWRDARDHEHHVAVRGGMLEVHGGTVVSVATQDAATGDDLHKLESDVLARYRRQAVEEQTARTDARRLQLAAIRQIVQLLRSDRVAAIPGGPIGRSGEGFK